MHMKKSKEEESVEKVAMANCVDIMKRNESLGRPKLFKCKKYFAIGQALGGHMRKHRDELNQLEQHKKKQKLDEHLIKSGELTEALHDKTKLKENLKSDELAEALHDKAGLDSTKRTLFLSLNLTTASSNSFSLFLVATNYAV
ncbi:hypothetical protein RDI58_007659 [Solanum bulbocastanum]|uniref:C2H2-type domain-containing protein n=1 Tax=Solanum bulbocastanum TaxID=147425 RepID=A0AAN8TZ84_SOLBU